MKTLTIILSLVALVALGDNGVETHDAIVNIGYQKVVFRKGYIRTYVKKTWDGQKTKPYLWTDVDFKDTIINVFVFVYGGDTLAAYVYSKPSDVKILNLINDSLLKYYNVKTPYTSDLAELDKQKVNDEGGVVFLERMNDKFMLSDKAECLYGKYGVNFRQITFDDQGNEVPYYNNRFDATINYNENKIVSIDK